MINARSYEEAAGLRREKPREPFPRGPVKGFVQTAGSTQRKDEGSGPPIRPDGNLEIDLNEALEKFDKPKMVTFDKSFSVPWDLLRDLNRSGQTIVMVTHDRDLAREADELVQLVDGAVVK